MKRGWSLVEIMLTMILTTSFMLFAGSVTVHARSQYTALAHYADDLNRGASQLDAIGLDVRRAWRLRDATPDGSIRAGKTVLVLERPNREWVVYRVRSQAGAGPRLERLVGKPGAWVTEDLGRLGSLQFDSRQAHGVAFSVGLVARDGGQPGLLSSAATCATGVLK